MTSRLDTPISRQAWLALIVAGALFLAALLFVIYQMASADPVLDPSSAPGGSAVSGSR